jgi:hypothetical protein
MKLEVYVTVYSFRLYKLDLSLRRYYLTSSTLVRAAFCLQHEHDLKTFVMGIAILGTILILKGDIADNYNFILVMGVE